jgi:hypothetical protein
MKTLDDSIMTDEKWFIERKTALENEIQKRLVEQLAIRTQTQSTSPEQQSLIEELYLDLKFINPELALNTLKAYASLRNAGIKLKLTNANPNVNNNDNIDNNNNNNKANSLNNLNNASLANLESKSKKENTPDKNMTLTSKSKREIVLQNKEGSISSSNKEETNNKVGVREGCSTIKVKQLLKAKEAINNIKKLENGELKLKQQQPIETSTTMATAKVDLSPSAILKKLETEIQKRLYTQLEQVKYQKDPINQEQINYIEQLYHDLELVNPELAFQTLQSIKSSPKSSSNPNCSCSAKNYCSLSKRHTITRPPSQLGKPDLDSLKFKSTSKVR